MRCSFSWTSLLMCTIRQRRTWQGYYKMLVKTGDLGYVDEDSFVVLTSRKKTLIITKNVSPEEIENELGKNRIVQEVLVRRVGRKSSLPDF